MNKRTSVVWSISKDELRKVVKNSESFSQILKHFGLYNKGGNIKTLKRRLEEEEINYSHIPLGHNSNIGRTFAKEKIPLEEIMTENSMFSRGHLKKRLLKENLIENRCSECGQKEIWNGKKLIMVLDHINGVSNDHRLENLRMLCPNCNSQQKTFAGKRNKKQYYCKECGKEKKYKTGQMCFECSKKINGNKRRKVKNRPSKDQLFQEIKEMGYCGTGRKYGVSDNAIRKWVK